MKQRNSSIDAIKGIAIVLVMIGHVLVHNHMEDPYLYDFIKAVQMPLFMIVSGYLCGHGRKVSSWVEYRTILKKRAMSYLIPFFSWLTVMHIGDLKTAYQTIFFQLDYGLWFLAVLFLLTFMVYTAQWVSEMPGVNKTWLSEIIFWGVCGFFCVILILQILTGNHLFSPYLTILYVPFYMAGYVIGNYGKKFLCWGTQENGKIDCKNSFLICLGVILLTLLFFYLVAAKDLNSMETRLDTLQQMLASVCGCIGIIYGVLLLRDGKIKNIFAKLGNYTLEIYVIHYHFANMLNFHERTYEFYSPEGMLFAIASFLAMSASTFCCIWLMKKIRILDFLFFGRKA